MKSILEQVLLEDEEETYSTVLINDIKLKNGDVIPSGSKAICKFRDDNSLLLTVGGREKPIRIPYTSSWKFLRGFKKPPSMSSLEKMSNNSISTTPLGNRTELDGHGTNGEPSWFIVLGLI